MLNLPTTKQLRYFVALAEHRHFGRAAEACFVSQSAFSIAIKELESLLQTRLVDRNNRQVTVTALGKEVATQARLCLRDLETLVEIAQTERDPLGGSIRLGVIPTIAPFLLPRVLPGLRKTFPQLKLFLHEDVTQELHTRLMEGELDAILIAFPYDLRGVETMKLFRDRFMLACREGTTLVDPTNYRFSRLNEESVLLLEDGHCLRDHAIAACRIRDTQKVRRFAASSLLTLIEMVDADLGVTFLPEMAEGSAMLQATGVRTYPLPERSHRQVGLAWRRGTGSAQAFESLGESILEQYEKTFKRRSRKRT